MKRIAIFALALILVTTVSVAQEAQEEAMYVNLTYVKIKAGMDEALMSALADHLEWHKSTNDTHYYNVARVMTGARSGQLIWSAGPMTGAQMDEAGTFEADYQDLVARGVMKFVDGTETVILRTMPNLGNPPPPGEAKPMVHITELTLRHGRIDEFSEALTKLDEAQKAAGPSDDYSAWAAPVSGTSFAKRWAVNWVDGWADTDNVDPERQAKMMEAAGGEEAFQELVDAIMGSIAESTVATHMNLPHLSFRPEGQ